MAFQCTVCRYIYEQDGQKNSSDRLALFEQLPGAWRCPACGVAKSLFKKLDEHSKACIAQQQEDKDKQQ